MSYKTTWVVGDLAVTIIQGVLPFTKARSHQTFA